MYNDGSINIIYENGNLHVQIRNSSNSIVGKVKPSCEGSIIFGDNEQKTFEFNEKNKEIVWYGRRAINKWIKGCFSDVIHIFFFIRYPQSPFFWCIIQAFGENLTEETSSLAI